MRCQIDRKVLKVPVFRISDHGYSPCNRRIVGT